MRAGWWAASSSITDLAVGAAEAVEVCLELLEPPLVAVPLLLGRREEALDLAPPLPFHLDGVAAVLAQPPLEQLQLRELLRVLLLELLLRAGQTPLPHLHVAQGLAQLRLQPNVLGLFSERARKGVREGGST